MEKVLKSKIRKYIFQRKVFRAIEALASITLVIMLISLGEKLGNVVLCLLEVLLVPEAFLLVHRSEIRFLIRNKKKIAKKDFEFYSSMKSEYEQMKDELISLGSKKIISDECRQLVWKEEMGIGWLSTKIKEFQKKCDETEQIIKNLESIKKRLVIF